jgi:hypothetical protein
MADNNLISPDTTPLTSLVDLSGSTDTLVAAPPTIVDPTGSMDVAATEKATATTAMKESEFIPPPMPEPPPPDVYQASSASVLSQDGEGGPVDENSPLPAGGGYGMLQKSGGESPEEAGVQHPHEEESMSIDQSTTPMDESTTTRSIDSLLPNQGEAKSTANTIGDGNGEEELAARAKNIPRPEAPFENPWAATPPSATTIMPSSLPPVIVSIPTEIGGTTTNTVEEDTSTPASTSPADIEETTSDQLAVEQLFSTGDFMPSPTPATNTITDAALSGGNGRNLQKVEESPAGGGGVEGDVDDGTIMDGSGGYGSLQKARHFSGGGTEQQPSDVDDGITTPSPSSSIAAAESPLASEAVIDVVATTTTTTATLDGGSSTALSTPALATFNTDDDEPTLPPSLDCGDGTGAGSIVKLPSVSNNKTAPNDRKESSSSLATTSLASAIEPSKKTSTSSSSSVNNGASTDTTSSSTQTTTTEDSPVNSGLLKMTAKGSGNGAAGGGGGGYGCMQSSPSSETLIVDGAAATPEVHGGDGGSDGEDHGAATVTTTTTMTELTDAPIPTSEAATVLMSFPQQEPIAMTTSESTTTSNGDVARATESSSSTTTTTTVSPDAALVPFPPIISTTTPMPSGAAEVAGMPSSSTSTDGVLPSTPTETNTYEGIGKGDGMLPRPQSNGGYGTAMGGGGVGVVDEEGLGTGVEHMEPPPPSEGTTETTTDVVPTTTLLAVDVTTSSVTTAIEQDSSASSASTDSFSSSPSTTTITTSPTPSAVDGTTESGISPVGGGTIKGAASGRGGFGSSLGNSGPPPAMGAGMFNLFTEITYTYSALK